MTPIIEQGSVKVELIYMLYDSPDCKVYVVQTDVKQPVVFSTENERLELVIYPKTPEGWAAVSCDPTRVWLHKIGSRRHTTTVETAKCSTIVTSVFFPEEPEVIYDSEIQGDQ